jgi:hypothetical protein
LPASSPTCVSHKRWVVAHDEPNTAVCHLNGPSQV